MADKMDRGLDDIIAETRPNGPRNSRRGGRGGRRGDRGDRSDRSDRNDRQDYPRDGSFRTNEPRNIDSEWVHDRFEDNSRRASAPRRQRESPDAAARGSKLRVTNVHYDLTEEDLDELFKRIGPVAKLQLRYDRAGRSEGTAFVTYESEHDAEEAIRQFDGANANGQPIHLTLLAGGPSRNPFDSAVMPGRPLSERVSTPGGRSRSLSSSRKYDRDDAARRGIDRYIPRGGNNRSRSPAPHRRGGGGGRRPGARREGAARESEAGRGGRGGPRGKKTQEELDAEMADYFGGDGPAPAQEATAAPSNATATAATGPVDDIDMIE